MTTGGDRFYYGGPVPGGPPPSMEHALHQLHQAGIDAEANVASLVWWAISTSRWLRPPWWRLAARARWRAHQQPIDLLLAAQAVLRGDATRFLQVGLRYDGDHVEVPPPDVRRWEA